MTSSNCISDSCTGLWSYQDNRLTAKLMITWYKLFLTRSWTRMILKCTVSLQISCVMDYTLPCSPMRPSWAALYGMFKTSYTFSRFLPQKLTNFWTTCTSQQRWLKKSLQSSGIKTNKGYCSPTKAACCLKKNSWKLSRVNNSQDATGS